MDFLKITKLFAQDLYAIPDYQRDYEWTNSQNSTLIDDIFSILRDPSSSNHFLGAIVTIPFEESNAVNKSIDFDDYSIEKDIVKHVVDGQQRLTSYSVLIKAIYDVLNEDISVQDAFKDNCLSMLRPLINSSATDSNFRPAPRLILNGNTGFCYNKDILGIRDDTCNRGYRGAKRILNAYKLFKQEIVQKKIELISDGICETEQDYFKKLIDIITKKMVFVEIECDASSDAFQVFDSLNGKGLDLTAADRIKNVMMSWSPAGKGAQKWDALVQQIGEDYLASFFVSLFFFNCGRRVSKNKLPDEFKNKYKNSAQTDFNYFYNDLKNDGIIYGKLRTNRTGVDKLDAILKDFQSLKQDQVYVMLFAAAKHFGENSFETGEYLKFAGTLLALVIRMQVCEKNMNKLDTIFSECIDMMKNQSASLNVVCNKLIDKKNNIAPDYQFELNFARFAPKDSKIEEFYLRHLEAFRRKQKGNRSPVERGLTVEHIIPQTLDDLSQWYGSTPVPDEVREDFQDSVVENIGNKMLLYGDDNTSAGNNDYLTKQGTYRTGKRGQNEGTPVDTFQLVKDLLEKYTDVFNHEEVQARAKELAKYAVDIW
ncbi:MAG: DUF262 domain-containing HNH endonuclease family protein [Synergistes sp.]|nr:DUF262 domain-containing HNH endonuclease family protein [Synergistes sp.]